MLSSQGNSEKLDSSVQLKCWATQGNDEVNGRNCREDWEKFLSLLTIRCKIQNVGFLQRSSQEQVQWIACLSSETWETNWVRLDGVVSFRKGMKRKKGLS